MRIRISELNASERSQLLANAVNQRGKDFAEWCERVDAPIIGCFDISASNEGADYWIKVSAGSLSNLGEVTLKSAEIALSIEAKEKSTDSGELQVGRWYGARDGQSRDIISMFRYNGKSSGRIGWNKNGEWRNDLDDSLDEFIELAPMEMVTLAFAAEARKRGYALGVNTEYGMIDDADEEHEYNQRGDNEDYFFFHNIKVYKNGDWSHCSITNPAIPSRSKEHDEIDEALRQLIDKLARLN